jgi:hypothetical protein
VVQQQEEESLEEQQPAAEQPGSAAAARAAELLALAVVVERPVAPWVMEATGRLQRTWWSTALECLEKEAAGLGPGLQEQ